MIQWLHQLSKSWVASLLMGLLALSFVAWGIGDMFTGASDTTAIKVGGTEIGADMFANNYKRYLRRASAQSHIELTPDDARRQGLPAIVEQELISQTVMVNMAQDMGVEASQESAVAMIRAIPRFAGVTGGFDHQVFLAEMENLGYSENEFIDEVRGELTTQTLERALTDGFEAPSTYMLTLLAYLGERRAADYVLITPDMAGAIPTPSDAVLAAYVKAHPEKFSTPEYRDVSYAEISPQDVMSQIAVTDAQIQQEYDATKATYVIPEKRDLQQLEFSGEAAAAAARARIAGGMSFDALLASEHKTPAQVSLGTLTSADIPDADRAKAAFALPLNEVSQPVKSALGGWVLLRATRIVPGSNKTLAQARDDIRKGLAAQLANSKMTDIANAFSDARAGGDDIATAAKKAGMKSGHIAAIDSNGLGPDGKKIDADPDFVAAVFKSEIGDDVDPFPTAAGNYFALKVNGTSPPKLLALDAVRAEAIAAWTSEQRAIRLTAMVRALTAQAQKARSLAGVAQSLHTGIRKSPGLDRGGNSAVFSADVIDSLFETAPGGITAGPTGDGNYVIALLTGIDHPKPKGGEGFMRYAAQKISGQIAQDIPVSLANEGRDKQGVKVNQKLIDAATGEGS
ncbi:MAG TPA: SurA N-terminal domain-containing protein [Rhizomicrobium sp.]